MPRALRIERGELVDGKEKSSKEKNSEEKEALAHRCINGPEFLRGHNPNFNPGGEFISPPGFFVRTLISCEVEQPRSKTFNDTPRDPSTPLRFAQDDKFGFPSCTLNSLCDVMLPDEALSRRSGKCRPRCR
jgi:hypothetical protein